LETFPGLWMDKRRNEKEKYRLSLVLVGDHTHCPCFHSKPPDRRPPTAPRCKVQLPPPGQYLGRLPRAPNSTLRLRPSCGRHRPFQASFFPCPSPPESVNEGEGALNQTAGAAVGLTRVGQPPVWACAGGRGSRRRPSFVPPGFLAPACRNGPACRGR